MRLSIVIVTHNRREALARTLSKVTGLTDFNSDQHEIIVVDNHCTDGTEEMLRRDWPGVIALRMKGNQGACARNHGLAVARGKYVMLLDDDSYPLGHTLSHSLHYLDEHDEVGAVGGKVSLPDGKCEASAQPTVIINCGTVLRKSALDQVGFFPLEFIRQAEEYDLSWRLWQAGYRVERFEDLEYRHEKSPVQRSIGWIQQLDLRNNLILTERYLPKAWRKAFRDDWTQRYFALAQQAGHLKYVKRGWRQAQYWRLRTMLTGRKILSPQALESIFGFHEQAQRIEDWARLHQVKKVLIADVAKTIFVTFCACELAQLKMVGVVDNHPAYQGMMYRGLPVMNDTDAAQNNFDGVVLANVNPAQVAMRLQALQPWCDKPIIALWQPRYLHKQPQQADQSQAA